MISYCNAGNRSLSIDAIDVKPPIAIAEGSWLNGFLFGLFLVVSILKKSGKKKKKLQMLKIYYFFLLYINIILLKTD